MSTAAAPLGLYVHVPYCASRCGYCDFNTYAVGEAESGSQAQWREAALAELGRARDTIVGDRPITTVFIGGGTPTLLPAADLATVVERARQLFGLTAGAEVTVEANPETITPALLDDLLAGGVNRLSLGMQSADPSVLRVLDRRHTPGGAARAVRLARTAGFERLSLDLIYGTPGEKEASWRGSLRAAIDTGVTHVSAYALKVEHGTALARRVARQQVAAPDDDEAATAYEIADQLLTDAGLPWYEISNWAAPGQECRHNLGYWRGADWWGIGPGAHSHLAGRRWWNVKHPSTWIAAAARGASPEQGAEVLSAGDLLTEFVMLRVRLAEGLPLAELRELTVDAAAVDSAADGLVADGLAVRDQDRLRLTLPGRRTADAVTLRLLG